MSVTVEEAHRAVVRAREQVLSSGVTGADVDAVASTLAALTLLEGQTTRQSTTQQIGTSPAMTETFGEWATEFNLGSHNDKFLAVAIYLREHQQARSVSTDDFMQMYRKARWDKPQNPADVLGKAAKRLYFTEDDASTEGEDTKKRWMVTKSGYNYFQGLRKEGSNGR